MTNSEYIATLREAIRTSHIPLGNGDSDFYDKFGEWPQVVMRNANNDFLNLLESKEWAVVPVKLTETMIDATFSISDYDGSQELYDKILAAAPQYQPEKLDDK